MANLNIPKQLQQPATKLHDIVTYLAEVEGLSPLQIKQRVGQWRLAVPCLAKIPAEQLSSRLDRTMEVALMAFSFDDQDDEEDPFVDALDALRVGVEENTKALNQVVVLLERLVAKQGLDS